MLLIDAHLDLAYNAINLGRDLVATVTEGRLRAIETSAEWRDHAGTLTTTWPEIRTHAPAVVCGTIFILPEAASTSLEGAAYATPEEAREQAWAQVEWYGQMAAAGHCRLITSQAQLEAVCAEAPPYGPPGLVLLMEGADGLLAPDELGRWHAAGLRWLGPAWQGTRYCGGTMVPGPLTALGIELIGEMDRLAVALDVSHLAEESFWQALALFRGPVAASHANCRALLGPDQAQRFLSDAMIQAIVERDGVIGLALYNKMLVNPWDERKESVALADLVRHIEHVCALAGSTRHVAIGSDLDGGFGLEAIPAELNTWGDLAKIGDALQDAGWQPADIANVLGANWRRWLGRALG
ncbi:MAG: membrane dipeptidase [Herpetosiphonaceae bacterium]|nr:membrane dipeptidase [Herpetosiphonaceae bacterium]